MRNRTKGQVEAAISDEIIRFEREIMGRGPTEIRTYILQDMVIVRLKSVLTRAEIRLIESASADLLKQTRAKLLESGREFLDKMIYELTACAVVSMHADVSTKTGERMIVFVLSENLEAKFL